MSHASLTVVIVGLAGAFSLSACADIDATTPDDEEPTDVAEDEIVEEKTVDIFKEFDHPVDKDFSKTFNGEEFRRGAFAVQPSLTAKVGLDLTDVTLRGKVTYTKSRTGRFTIRTADITTKGHYNVTGELGLKVRGTGNLKEIRNYQKDWESSSPLGGKSLELVRNVLPTNIPVGGPLFVHVHFDLAVECGIGLEAQVEAKTGLGIAGDLSVRGKYDRAKRLPGGKKFQFTGSAPNFRVEPKPWVTFDQEAKIHGRCSLQPTVVILLERLVGAKVAVEPYIDVVAQERGIPPTFKIDAKAGVEGHVETDVEVFGHPLFKPKEFTLFDKPLYSRTF